MCSFLVFLVFFSPPTNTDFTVALRTNAGSTQHHAAIYSSKKKIRLHSSNHKRSHRVVTICGMKTTQVSQKKSD